MLAVWLLAAAALAAAQSKPFVHPGMLQTRDALEAGFGEPAPRAEFPVSDSSDIVIPQNEAARNRANGLHVSESS